MLKNGIYEQIINEEINQELIDKNNEKHIEKEKEETNDEDCEKMSVTDDGEQLLALYDKKNTILFEHSMKMILII